MDSSIVLYGKKIELLPCTNELWHKIFKHYSPDPMMDTSSYIYCFDSCDKGFYQKTTDETRRYFAIIHKSEPVGIIYLKNMNKRENITEFGIALTNDSVKGNGFGTEAIKLLVEYAFGVMEFEIIAADSVIRNARSQHVLEKAGFRLTHEDDVFRYYRLKKGFNSSA